MFATLPEVLSPPFLIQILLNQILLSPLMNTHALIAIIRPIRPRTLPINPTIRQTQRTRLRLRPSIIQQQRRNPMRRQPNSDIAQRRPIVRVRPHIVYIVKPPRSDGPALSQIEEHVLRGIERVQ